MKKIIAAALVIVMMMSLSAVAFAADSFISPSGDDFYNVTVKVKDDKGGTASSSAVTVKKGDTVEIKAKPDSGNTFGGWTFTGEFEWVSGDANSETIVVRPLSDIVFIAEFKGAGGPEKDNGGESPETGYNTVATVAFMSVIVLASAAAVVYTGKKYFDAE